MEHTKIILALFLLSSSLFATDVSANFQNNFPSYFRFNTDMRMTSDFAITVGGNPVSNGGDVCGGATVHVVPTVSAKWATSSLDIISSYPTCDPSPAYCPAMVDAGALTTNPNVKWLTGPIFDKHDAFGDAGGYIYDYTLPLSQEYYADLGTFRNQPVTYLPIPGGTAYPGKEAGVNVFCKGQIVVKDGSTVISSTDMTSVGPTDFTITTNGAHTISTSLEGVSCIGVVLKHPLDTGAPGPEKFRMYYFTQNQPSFGASTGLKTISVTVQPAGGSCAFHDTHVEASSSPADADLTMAKVTIHNDGDQAKVVSVASSNAGFSVSAFPVGLCAVLGFPGGLCPGSNGFNECIATSGEKPVYVLIEKLAAASGGTVLTFTEQTCGSTCGGTKQCTHPVDDLTGPAFCAITPSSLTYGTLEAAQFTVACEDLSHNPITCTGSNWFWADGLAGGFVEKDNTHAIAYPTSSPGSSGTLRYKTTTGLAECFSNINVVQPKYECEFIPPNANLHYNGGKYFQLNCFESGSKKTPDSADYQFIDGLDGTLGNDSTSGVGYTAPNYDSNGKLLGFGQFNTATPPVLGAVALAPIIVTGGNNSNNSTGCTGDCGPHTGDSKYCRIGTELQNVFSGYTGWVSIRCGEHGNETCTSAVWWTVTDPPGSASTNGGSNTGTFVTITGGKGTTGRVYAYVNGDANHNCFTDFVVGERQCWEIT